MPLNNRDSLYRTAKLGSLVLLLAILSACANLPIGGSKKPPSDDTVQPTNEGAVGESDAEAVDTSVPFAPIAKPASTRSSNVPDSARNEFVRAKQAMSAKRWQDAETTLLLMTETYPGLSGVYVNLGIVYSQLERFEDAENAYKFAIKTNELNFDAYTNLGVLYREQGKFVEAESVYLDALSLWPHHLESRRNLGILYDLYMGKPEQALPHFIVAQQIMGGDNRELKGWIIDLQRRTGQK